MSNDKMINDKMINELAKGLNFERGYAIAGVLADALVHIFPGKSAEGRMAEIKHRALTTLRAKTPATGWS